MSASTAAKIAEQQQAAEENAAAQAEEDDEAEGEYGFVDPDGYQAEQDDDGVVDGNGNVDYDDGTQQDTYTEEDYDYTYENNDGMVYDE